MHSNGIICDMSELQSKSWNIYRGMSLYKRKDSPRFYGMLRINKKYYRKCLNTENKNEAEELLFQWKQEILSDPKSPVAEENKTFRYFADQLLDKEKTYLISPSGYEPYKTTEKMLNREKGCLEYFGNTDIRSIKTSDVDKFVNQLPIGNRRLTKSTVKKHLNVVRKVLNMGDVNIRFPKLNGNSLPSERRGYFTKEEYKALRDASLKLVGHEYKHTNGTIYRIDRDMHDLIVFMVGSSLRPTTSEVYCLQHKDIKIKKTKKGTTYLEFYVDRKNKPMVVQTQATSYYSYRDLCERREDFLPEDYVFYPQYKNRNYCKDVCIRQFGELLIQTDLKYSQLKEKRTLYSLRHTAIIYTLSQKGLDQMEVCARADTSMKMLKDWYYPSSQMDEKLGQFLVEENLTI